jgi:hypothetical protein
VIERMGRQIDWHAVENFDKLAGELNFRLFSVCFQNSPLPELAQEQ